jgi:DNA-binding response OmpR family regulator
MNVLIADDDSITRLLLGSVLSRLGHNVDVAENGSKAWEYWRRRHQTLIISDWVMPDLDGLEFCRRIRASERSDLTYIILLTARAGKNNYLEAMQAGVDDFISKPFDKEELAARVRVADRILSLHATLRRANTDLEGGIRERTIELEKALRVKSEFLSRASHELRTPMNHILGFAQLLALDSLTSEQSESVQHILTGGHRLLALIDRILAVSKSHPEELSFLEGERDRESAHVELQ